MSILNAIPQAQLKDFFVYRGLFAGVVPIYLGDLKPGEHEAGICEQNGIPELALTLAIVLMDIGGRLAFALGIQPKDPRGWNPVWITSRIDGKPLAKDPDYLEYMTPQTDDDQDEPKP